MNKTKKYTVVGVLICFLVIGILSVYNNFQSNSLQEKELVTIQEKAPETENDNSKSVDKQSEEKKTTENKEAKNTSEKKSTPKITEKKVTQKKSNQSKTSTDSKVTVDKNKKTNTQKKFVTNQKEDSKIQVYVSIQGLNSKMASGNVKVEKDATIYDALKTLAQSKGIKLSTSGYGSTIYIRGINGLYEFDHGAKSGWMYSVNGVKPSAGAGSYHVKKGDKILWEYVT